MTSSPATVERGAVGGIVFDLQRYCVHDGPGIRTTVFLKGCPLQCAWCHNPESRDPRPELSYAPERCIGCAACVATCPHGAHALRDGRHVFDRSACRVCGRCAGVCAARALTMIGTRRTVGEVMREVLSDRTFYERSGGGLTISGGEPLAQAAFTTALLAEAKQAGLNTCLETSGSAPTEVLLAVAPLVDLFLFDTKASDSSLHRSFTGVELAPVLANLHALDRAGARIILRCPLIPGWNDDAERIAGIAQLATSLDHLIAIEVLPYHAMGQDKARRIGSSREVEIGGMTDVKTWIGALQPRVGVPVREA